MLCFEICTPSLFSLSPLWTANFKTKYALNLRRFDPRIDSTPVISAVAPLHLNHVGAHEPHLLDLQQLEQTPRHGRRPLPTPGDLQHEDLQGGGQAPSQIFTGLGDNSTTELYDHSFVSVWLLFLLEVAAKVYYLPGLGGSCCSAHLPNGEI